MNAAVQCKDVLPPACEEWTDPLNVEIPTGILAIVETPQAIRASLVRLCAGLVPARSGRVGVLGTSWHRLGRRAASYLRSRLGIGLTPGGLFSNQTLRLNIAIPLIYHGTTGLREALRRADSVLELCDLVRWAHYRPSDVPEAVRQTAVVGRALVGKPDLLLLEDPFTGMSAADTERLACVCREGAGTIVVATHTCDEAIGQFADLVVNWDGQRISMMHDAVGAV